MDLALRTCQQQHLRRQIEDEVPALTEEEKEHDLLSFLSIILKACDSYNAAFILLGVLMPNDVYPSHSKGAYFQVSILSPREVLSAVPKNDHPILLGEGGKALELVALKSPIIVGSRNSARNRKIWSAMATEFAILKNKHLEKHENIVRILGVCWQPSADTTPMPALILEAAQMDMEKFFSGGRPTSLPQLLKLAVQITSGVEAIHAVGVIHGDIKPQNILMFREGESSWTAKIADFGSSLIRVGIDGRISFQFGSRFWQAPETTRPLLAVELEKADIFSLGMVLWKILSRNSQITHLQEQAYSEDTSTIEATLEELKRSGGLASLALSSVRWALSPVDIPGFDDDDDDYTMAIHLAGIVGLSLNPPYARKDATLMLSDLRRAQDYFENEDPMDNLNEILLREERTGDDSSQATELAVLEVDQIPNMIQNSGTLRILPRNLYQRIIDEVRDVALHSKNENRRWDAAFEYSFHILDSVQICQETQATIDEALDLLRQAAVHDIGDSRNVIGYWFTALNKPNPLPLEQERSWLFDGVLSGSETASRRLKQIDGQLHSSATYYLRTERAGIGLPIPNYGDLLFYCNTIDHIDSYEELIEGISKAILEFAAMTGYTRALAKLLDLRPELDINATGPFNTTPLMRACVAGHLDIVRELLEHNAKPTIAASDGTTPLHFLSSFPEKDIPAAAKALIQAGAALEVRSPDGPKPMPPVDSYLCVARGTPLSFATAAANLHAVRVLIANGADPFDVAGEAVASGDGFHNMIHTSPVVLASINHLPNILEALLFGQDAVRVASFIGPHLTSVGTRGTRYMTSCLAWAVDFLARGLLCRMKYNGQRYRDAFIETFKVLVRHGADPLDVDGQQTTVLEAAIPHGQPYVVEFLMKWRGGLLMKEATKWIACLTRAVVAQDTVIFNILLSQPPENEPSVNSRLEYFVAVCMCSDDVGFLTPLEAKLSPDTDGTDMLWASMEKGHLTVASWVYARTRVDFARKKDGRTLLGHLLLFSKKQADVRRAVAHFLKLDGLSDSVFFDVGTILGSSLTALQMAAFYFEYEGAVLMAGSTLRMVLERWDAPEFLNHQVPDGQLRGSTAIMIAARTANSAGLKYLLSEVGDEMDLGLLDAKAYNVYDRAILNLSSQTRQMELMNVPARHHEVADLAHFDHTVQIVCALGNIGLRPNRISRAIVRTETDVFCDFKFGTRLDITEWEFPGGVVPESVSARNPVFAEMSQLDVDSALYSKRPDPSDDADEEDAGSSVAAASKRGPAEKKRGGREDAVGD